jgi:hypothetical protein
MKLSRIGRVSMAFVVSVAMGLGMTACGGGTIGFMWVLGTQFNQIAGFKIDDFSGNLTQVVHSPFSSGGVDPVSIVVSTGGRFVYVVNHGLADGATPPAGSDSLPCGTAGGVAEFSVGGQGVLSYQQCFIPQGTGPVWAAVDSTGGFLYVLTQHAPGFGPDPTSVPVQATGAVTVFAIAADTGRLSLVLNQQVKDPTTQAQLSYFPVGTSPSMLTVAGTGCLFTLNNGDGTATTPPTVTPYATGTAGQLTVTTNQAIQINATRPTSIQTGGSNVYITDAGAQNSPGQILPFTVGTASSCSLNTFTGGPVTNLSGTANPVYTLTDSTTTYFYVANQSGTSSLVPSSSISGFHLQPTSQMTQLPGTNNPYTTGGGPICMVEDPSHQYLYTSNGDGTVTGKVLDRNSGELSDLSRGSTFTAVGQATCLAVSGNID